MARDFARGFYASPTWRKQRQFILMRDNFICTEPNCHKVATEVHHIVELTEDNISNPEISLGPSNLRSLCHDCHSRITKEMKQKNSDVLEQIFFDADGYPAPYPNPKQ